MNNIILTGCTLTYSSVFLLGIDGRVVNERAFAVVCSVSKSLFQRLMAPIVLLLLNR